MPEENPATKPLIPTVAIMETAPKRKYEDMKRMRNRRIFLKIELLKVSRYGSSSLIFPKKFKRYEYSESSN